MVLPAQVHEVTQTYLGLVDNAVPGLVEGLYLHGSVALGDFQPGRSDIDFTALVRERPSEEETNALAAVHEELDRRHPRPDFDGVYLTRVDLANDPDECPDVPGTLETKFEPRCRFGLGPVTWHELHDHGVVVRGPGLDELDLWTDKAKLLDFTRNNLDTYWRSWIGNLERIPKKSPERAGDPWFVEWCVLGVVRLHALLATGRLHTKGSAGRYALQTFESRWTPLLKEALRIRSGDTDSSTYSDPLHRLDETRELVAMVVKKYDADDDSARVSAT